MMPVRTPKMLAAGTLALSVLLLLVPGASAEPQGRSDGGGLCCVHLESGATLTERCCLDAQALVEDRCCLRLD